MPYSVEYQGELARAAELLREAAAATTQPTLKRFLEKRAAAFLSNDYYESDVAWMELDALARADDRALRDLRGRLVRLQGGVRGVHHGARRRGVGEARAARAELQWLENALPIDPTLRNPKLGGDRPIRVVDVVFSAGDGNRGVQTAAYNLPNDERVVAREGQQARDAEEHAAGQVRQGAPCRSRRWRSPPADQPNVDFDAFFTHILMHELMHGLGPQTITKDGKPDRRCASSCKDLYCAIEEAKADISGLWALQQLVDKGVLDRSLERTMYTTFLASAFRSIRFGIDEAHGEGQALQLNHLLDAGAFRVAADGTFSVDAAKVKGGGHGARRAS